MGTEKLLNKPKTACCQFQACNKTWTAIKKKEIKKEEEEDEENLHISTIRSFNSSWFIE